MRFYHAWEELCLLMAPARKVGLVAGRATRISSPLSRGPVCMSSHWGLSQEVRNLRVKPQGVAYSRV